MITFFFVNFMEYKRHLKRTHFANLMCCNIAFCHSGHKLLSAAQCSSEYPEMQLRPGFQHTVHCELYTVQCTLHTVHCAVCTVQYTMYNVQCIIQSVFCTLYTVTEQTSLCTLKCTLYNVHCKMYIQPLASYIPPSKS